ncbi:MAG: transcriptional repressor [Dehalococcoidales bacterium]|nr:transcriptional repressor [Dehalococcoidales bacterium]
MNDELSHRGYRMTPQRLMIVEAVENSTDHISADEIYSRVRAKYPNVNVSTVYRTLELLEQLGLVTRTDLGGGRVVYHPIAKGHHHHLVCKECGAIIDLDESVLSGLKESLLRQYQFVADLRHLGIQGVCVNCRQRASQNAAESK